MPQAQESTPEREELHVKIPIIYWLSTGLGTLMVISSASAQISLSSAVDLALQNSTQVKMAIADVQKATASLAETKDAYLPNFLLGSSVGYTYGFPVGQPSVYNVQSQSLLYSFSQPAYVRASREALKSAELNLTDNREQIALDCALAYIQLETDVLELVELNEEKSDAEKLVSIEHDRLDTGVDSRMDETKAEITSAQVDISRFQIQDDAGNQRQKLADLTGLPAASFIPDANSIPPLPDFSNDDAATDQALASNAGIQSADATAKSKMEVYYGDEKQNYLPQFGFGLEYNRYAEFNNYNEYYLRFQHNNFDVGVQITIPLFDATRRAKAREAAADATHARIEADQTRNQASEQVETLRHGLKELHAQLRLMHLQSQFAQEQLETIQSELKDGTGSPNAAPVTPKEEELARIELQRRHTDVLNANLSVMRTELSLMRTIGAIEDWAHSPVK
jgi:outer membrane protein TolC